ncbi:MAG TPA: GNAT family N-acetyltransferase [Acidobacteriaceae bacterium]|nr:GNAT family N-acetyltransferase [Acidobacteriaceae bacterium]
MQIREARAEDFAELYALDQACFAPGISWSKAELGYFLKYPRNFALVAEAAPGQIAGFTIAGTVRRQGTVVGRLITLDVRLKMRRQRVGGALLEAVERRLRAAGATALLLEVAVDNASAQAFYGRHGFARTGRIRGYYLGRIDALTMERAL